MVVKGIKIFLVIEKRLSIEKYYEIFKGFMHGLSHVSFKIFGYF